VRLLQPPADWSRAERVAYLVGLVFLLLFAAAFVAEFFVSY
jgi:hypothetical protein